MRYSEDDYLMLSGLQHYFFCRRQWALIHIEKIWDENILTAEGKIMHERAHDVHSSERRGDVLTIRGLSIFSPALGVSGQCDIVEFHKSDEGTELRGYEGKWIPYPIEYKHGMGKSLYADEMQLCGQAMCLEEMLCCRVNKGAVFYGKTKRRTEIVFTDTMRDKVQKALFEMHDLQKKGHTPKVRMSKACNSCSLKDECLPGLSKQISVERYISNVLGELS